MSAAALRRAVLLPSNVALASWEWIGAGVPPGLQSRLGFVNSGAGGFDSHALPPHPEPEPEPVPVPDLP